MLQFLLGLVLDEGLNAGDAYLPGYFLDGLEDLGGQVLLAFAVSPPRQEYVSLLRLNVIQKVPIALNDGHLLVEFFLLMCFEPVVFSLGCSCM